MRLDENKKIILLLLILLGLCIIGTAQTVEEVRAEIKRQGIKSPQIVLKQSILETGWYTSHGCRKRKNLFGFWYKGKYLSFNTWQESITYYKNWQERHYNGGDYYDFLERIGYATDKNYINKLKAINP